jgi:uncharacterized protein (TIGR03437 family)
LEQTFTVTVTGNINNNPLTVGRVTGVNQWLTTCAQTCQGMQAPGPSATVPSASGQISFRAIVNPTGFNPGTYTTQLSVQMTGLTTQLIEVTLNVGAGANTVIANPPGPLSFVAAVNQTTPAQVVALTSGQQTNYNAVASANWVVLNSGVGGTGINVSGSSPGNLSISANATGLAVGNYSATVTITPTGGAAQTVISLNLSVSNTPQFQIPRTAIVFNFVANSGAPNPSDTFTVALTTAAVQAYTVTFNYNQAQQGWLSNSGTLTTGQNLTITANPAGLAIGSYTGSIRFQSAGVADVLIPVTLNVVTSGALQVSQNSVQFFASPSGSSQTRQVNVSSTTGAAVNTTATIQYTQPTNPSFNWLSTTGAGATPYVLNITATPGTLPVGSYTANVTITTGIAGITPVTIQVTMNVSTSQIASVNPVNLAFSFAGGGSTPASQNFTLALAPNTIQQTYFVGAVTDSGGQWLSAIAQGGGTSGVIGSAGASVTVSVNPTGLANGVYTGRVQVNVLGAVANPNIDVPVTLTVTNSTGGGGGGTTGPLTILLSQGNFSFFTTPNGGTAPAQTLTLTANTGGLVNYQLQPATFNGGNWLNLSVLNGTTPGTVTVTVNTAGLAAGTYNGQILLTAPGATNSGTGIPVTLTINASTQLQPTPSGLVFNYVQGSTNFPQAQSAQVFSSGSVLTYSANASTTGGGSWLSVNPQTATTGAQQLVVSVSAAILQSLQAATYTGFITITAGGAANSPYSLPVTLNVLAAGTGGGGGTGTAQLVTSPSQVTFYTLQGSTNVSPQTIALAVANGATAAYQVSVTSANNWLQLLSAANGTAPGSFQIGANVSGLPAGTYSGTVTITSTGTTNSPVNIPVTLIIGGQSQLVLAPQGLLFTSQSGSAPSAQAVTLFTTTNISAPYSFATSTSNGGNWLNASASSGTVTPGSLLVSVNPQGLAAGIYTGSVTISSGSVSNSPQVVQVTLVVTGQGGGSAGFNLSPASLTFFAQQNGAIPASRAVQVTATGSNTSYVVSTNQPWLLAGPQTGTTPGTITVGVNQTGLAAGTYTGSVTVGAGGITATIPVTLTVTNNPLLQVNTSQVNFSYQTSGQVPPARPIVVSTSTGQTLAFQTTAAVPSGTPNWLTVAPTSGTTAGVFSISLVPGVVQSLAPGSYDGTVTVTAGGADNSPLVINVRLVVSSTPLISVNSAPLNFNAQFSGNPPPTQTREITSTGAPVNVSVTAATQSGAGWLTATLNQQTTPATLSVSASPFGLATGVYTGTVTLTSLTNVITIPVTLNVSSQPLISVNPPELTFGVGAGGNVAPQSLQVSSTGTPIQYQVTTNVSGTAIQWLSANQTSGTTPSQITIAANPANLPDGQYFGTVTITAFGIGNSPIIVPVLLTINNATALVASPTSLTFNQTQGIFPSGSQNISVTSQVSTPFAFTAQTTTGGDWLSVTQVGGQTSGILQVALRNTTALVAGAYQGTITIFGSNSPNTVTIPVALNITPAASIASSLTNASFTFRPGSANPAPLTAQITASASGLSVPYTVDVTTQQGTGWLTASPTTGTTPGAVQIAVTPANLAAGTYNGQVRIVPGGAFTGAQALVIPVVLVVENVPAPVINAVVHGASFLPGGLAPGLLVSLFGTNMGPTTGAGLVVEGGRVGTRVANVRVLFDNIPAPLFFVRADQINCVVPYGLAGRASTRITVEVNGVQSQAVEFRLQETSPGIFSTDSSGRGQGAVFNDGVTLNGSNNAAARGSIVAVFLSGSGVMSPPLTDGEIPNSPRTPLASLTIRVGGVTVPAADVAYFGPAPGLVALEQVNFRIPQNAPTGPVLLEFTIGGRPTQGNLTMVIR